jgi:3-oxoacyl-[acyl-carrier-protein] synthase II
MEPDKMKNRARIAITGMGVVSPIGIGVGPFWEAVQAGASGTKRVDDRVNLDGIPTKIGAPVEEFTPDALRKMGRNPRKLDRAAQMVLVAAQEALSDAHLDLATEDLDRIGVIMGTGIGGIQTLIESHEQFLRQGPDRVSPRFVPQFMPNSLAAEIAISYGFRGINFGVVTACASANHALGLAGELLRGGFADVILTGGGEAAMAPLPYAGFSQAGALSQRNDEPERASRPFDRDRDGFVLGEGAAVLVLETLDHARQRGATVLAELLGVGMNDDAYHITAPDPEGRGAREAMARAVRQAGISPHQVDYINAHGTSTPLNDKIETLAIKALFGDHAGRLAISSTKSQIGHLLGAAAAVEAVATVLAIRDDLVPPTINYEHPDPECDLDYTPNRPAKRKVDVALSNSFGFGGHNAVIVLAKPGFGDRDG